MDQICGVVEHITYANEETGYSVIKIRDKSYIDLVVVVGNMASVNVGSVLTIKGEWTNNPKYGRQFNAINWEESLPASVYGMERYLGSGLIKGIGPQYAKKIVNLFQEDTFNTIENTPDRLIEVAGVGKKRVEMIKKAWHSQKEIKNIMLFLQGYGVSTAFGSRIYKAYGDNSINVVKQNPYQLADDIFGIGFKTADRIAQKLGIDKESYVRCRSGIFYVLNKFAENGHCYARTDDLAKRAVKILEIEESKIVMTIGRLILEKELIKEESDMCYLPPFFYSESGTAKRLIKILKTKIPKSENHIEIVNRTITSSTIQYDEIQIEAIKKASQSKIMILTGGPGTGKTTTMLAFVEMFKALGMSILLSAPTGRAAKRLSESTNMEAKTIHRLLEYKPPKGYEKSEKNQLIGDVLIIDESSMIDVILMYNLLKAIPDTMILIFVGDVDQLPSVGAGNILKDMINSEVIPVVKLQKIFRQAQNSDIIMNAHRVNCGENIIIRKNGNRDFFFIEKEREFASEEIVNLCSKRLPEYYKVSPVESIQVLTPMQKTDTGSLNLNLLLQKELNKNTILLRRGATEYKLGDKVMQVRNNYDKEIFNGDIGIIQSVNTEEKTLSVLFDGRLVEYEVLELDELVLAYATTIHKAQGSEYPIVIIPITFSHYVMLQRNLLYTALTRAKKVVIIVGDRKALSYAIQNIEVINRNTYLSERIKSSHSI